MTTITFKGNPIHTEGSLPAVDSKAPAFTVTKTDLTELSLSDLKGKKIVLNIFPSLDTPVCAKSVRKFNEFANNIPNVTVLCISKDLPFAQGRFCTAEGLSGVIAASVFRDSSLATHYGVEITDGPLKGLLARAIIIINEQGNISYTQQVPEITAEPDYDAVLTALQ